MKAEDVDAGLVEKTAREIYGEWENEYTGDYPWPAWESDENLSRDTARTWARNILAAVLPEIQAQAQQDLITDLLARHLADVEYLVSHYPIRAVPQAALLEHRNRIARLTATTEEPTDA